MCEPGPVWSTTAWTIPPGGPGIVKPDNGVSVPDSANHAPAPLSTVVQPAPPPSKPPSVTTSTAAGVIHGEAGLGPLSNGIGFPGLAYLPATALEKAIVRTKAERR